MIMCGIFNFVSYLCVFLNNVLQIFHICSNYFPAKSSKNHLYKLANKNNYRMHKWDYHNMLLLKD